MRPLASLLFLSLVTLAGVSIAVPAHAAPKRTKAAAPRKKAPSRPVAPVAPVAAPLPAAGTDAPPAPAVRPLRDELPPEALHDWDAARELYDAKDFEGASVEFQRAYELSKNPRVLFNVAICQKNLAHYARAVAVLKRELAEGGTALSAVDQARVREAIETIETFVTTLDLNVSEPNATVSIDGREVEARSPFTAPIPIEVGIHTITIHKHGFHDTTITVEAASKQPVIPAKVTLEPLVRRGIVSVNVGGAPLPRVLVDGVEMGFAPYVGEFPIGRHTIDARAVGHVSATASTELALDQRTVVNLELRAEKHEGRVRVDVLPLGAELFLDGRAVGGNLWEGTLPSGGHQFVARREGFEPQATEVSVADDQTRSIRIELQPRRSRHDWVWWTVGTVAVLGASAYTGYTLFRPTVIDPQPGSLNPGITFTQ